MHIEIQTPEFFEDKMRKLYTTIFTLAILLLSYNLVIGQSNYVTENSQWFNGTMRLTNGQIISGEFNYNFITGILSHRYEDKSDPYSALNVMYFELTDSQSSTIKKFFSIPFAPKGTRQEKMTFFEIIYEKGNLAILSRHEYDYKERAAGPNGNAGIGAYTHMGTITIEKVKEYLYLANNEGAILEYATKKKDKSMHFEFNSTFPLNSEVNPQQGYAESKTDRPADLKYRVINSNAINTMTISHQDQVQDFIASNDLKLNTVAELVQLLNFYATLEK